MGHTSTRRCVAPRTLCPVACTLDTALLLFLDRVLHTKHDDELGWHRTPIDILHSALDTEHWRTAFNPGSSPLYATSPSQHSFGLTVLIAIIG